MRIGVGLSADAVRAVACRGGRVVWAAEAPLTAEDPLTDLLAALLTKAPLPRWPRPTVGAAIGPHAAQVKLVDGLPETADPDLLATVIKGAVGSFFLKNGVPLLATGTRVVGAGAAWAAVLDRPGVIAVRDACRARGWRLTSVVPTAVVLPRAIQDERFTWKDGAVVLEIARRGPALEALRTRPVGDGEAEALPPNPVAVLAGLGEHAWRYADAYGAAVCDPAEPLGLDPSSELETPAERRRPYRAPAVLALVATAALLLSPLAGSWAAWRARTSLPNVRPGQWQVIRTALGQLDRVSAILGEVRSFAAHRSDVMTLLDGITRVLPTGAVVSELDVEDDQVQVTVLGADAAGVLAGLGRVRGATAVELSGPVSQELTQGGALQRTTVRFRIAAAGTGP